MKERTQILCISRIVEWERKQARKKSYIICRADEDEEVEERKHKKPKRKRKQRR